MAHGVAGATLLLVAVENRSTGGSTQLLTGTIAVTSTVTGVMPVAHKMSGTIAAQSVLTVTARVAHPLAGTIAAQSALTATARVAHPLVGSVVAISTVTATARVAHPLAGTIAVQSVVNGALAGGVVALGTGTIAVVSSLSATARVAHPLAGTIAATSALTATARVAHALTGTITSVSTVTTTAKVVHKMTGTIAAISNLFGTISGGSAPAAPALLIPITHALNQLAGTVGLDAQGAANVWAGTKNLDLVGALNFKNVSSGLEYNLVVKRLAATYGGYPLLEAEVALSGASDGGFSADFAFGGGMMESFAKSEAPPDVVPQTRSTKKKAVVASAIVGGAGIIAGVTKLLTGILL